MKTFAKPLVKPLVRGLAAADAGQARDPNAIAYANAVAAAGGSLSGSQRSALNRFVEAEKTAGRWTTLKALFLPVWGLPNPSRIDLKTLSTGSFVDAITHSPGYVASNVTGYFDLGKTPLGLGLSVAAGGFGWLSNGGGTGNALNAMGCQNSSTQTAIGQWFNTTGVRVLYNDAGAGLLAEGASVISQNHGIVSMQRHGGSRFIRRRVTAGVASLASNTSADSAAVPTVNIHAMAYNNNGTSSGGGTTIQYGAWFVNAGWSSADDDGFTANLKTLWESLTGLTLP